MGFLENWELGNGSGEWGVGNDDKVTGNGIYSVSKVFNSKVSCTEIFKELSCLNEKNLG